MVLSVNEDSESLRVSNMGRGMSSLSSFWAVLRLTR